VCGRAGV